MSHSQILGKLGKEEHSSLFCPSVIDEGNKIFGDSVNSVGDRMSNTNSTARTSNVRDQVSVIKLFF